MSKGVSDEVAALVLARSHGHCEIMLPGCTLAMEQIHHRRPRGMGGTKRAEANQAANLIAACAHCHSYVERYRTYGKNHGFLVPQGADPARVPVWWRRARHGRATGSPHLMVLLDNTGGIEQLPEETDYV